jgi:hypothetical protein
VMPKAKAGLLYGSRYLDIRALLGGEHVVRTTEVVGKRPVGRPTGSTQLMRSAEASTSAAAAADDIHKKGIRQVMRGIRILWIRALWIRMLWKQH